MKPQKLQNLEKILNGMRRVVLAFSGGVDSTFLLKVALDCIGSDNVLAVTAKSKAFPGREYAHAKKLAKGLSARFRTIHTRETKDKNFIRNPVNRCYYCKKELFGRLRAIAAAQGFETVIDGSNYDDRNDIRYGSRAARESGVRSPLDEAHIGKADIRRFSQHLKLSTWNKPSFACLASRFPYGQKITAEKLKQVDRAEQFLHELGFRQVRVRAHKDIARIEIADNGIRHLLANRKRKGEISNRLKQLGFSYITLDLDGYRTGSMNEAVKDIKRRTTAWSK